jgi:sugar lactone lactonase YvrE
MIEAVLAADAKAILGEGPHWDAESRLLYWIDIKGRRLHAYDPAKAADRSVPLESAPGAVVRRASGGLLAATAEGFAFVDPATGKASAILDPEAHMPGNRFNDGKCDSRGRFWAGTMAVSETGREGSLYRLDADLGCSRLLEGIGISNGLAWSLDDRILYYIDTPTRRVDAFDFDAETGGLSRRRVAFALPPSMGYPDGMTIDEEGMLWIALWDGWGLGRWDPLEGRQIGRVELPVARVSSCAFGGSASGEGGLDRLYVTTARAGLSAEELEAQPHAGSLFVLEPGLRGAASVPFAG